MAESEELNRFLMKVKEESEKTGLKLNIGKTKITASGPTTSWQIEGEKVETVTYFLFLGSIITVDCDCSHEIKHTCPLEEKAMTNLDSILKSRDVTLPTKVHPVKAMVSPVVMYGYESWTIKKSLALEDKFFQIVVWQKTIESHFHNKEIKQVNPKGNQLLISIRRTDAEAETPILWPPDVKS